MLKEILLAFLTGGCLCAIGQLLIDYTKLTPARILVAYVVAGVILGGVGVYQPLIELAGAGATCGRVTSEPPTLNDVFLEITGRALRDEAA